MSALANTLKALRHFLEGQGIALPTWDVRVVEIGPGAALDESGRFRVRRTEIRTVAEYEERFNELMNVGLPWLNVSCYGVDSGKMLIAIEVPKHSSNPVPRTSVNYSGPTAAVLEADWRVDSVLMLE